MKTVKWCDTWVPFWISYFFSLSLEFAFILTAVFPSPWHRASHATQKEAVVAKPRFEVTKQGHFWAQIKADWASLINSLGICLCVVSWPRPFHEKLVLDNGFMSCHFASIFDWKFTLLAKPRIFNWVLYAAHADHYENMKCQLSHLLGLNILAWKVEG